MRAHHVNLHGLSPTAQPQIADLLVFNYDPGLESTATHSSSPPDEARIIAVISEYIGIRPGYCGGEPHILGHRIKVRHVVVWHEEMRMSPAQIVTTYPTITLSRVHAALAYYFDHRDEIQTAIAAEDRFVEELKAKSGPSLLRNGSGNVRMPRTIQFHLDENVDPAIATGLKRHGIDATTTADAGLAWA